MDKKYNLSFIINRVKEIGSALMHDLDYENHPERLPANIVTVLKADERGLLWFFIRKPLSFNDNTPFSFPASLQFLRKGKNFFIKVNGTAHSTINMTPVTPFVTSEGQAEALSQLTLIEMKISSIEYCEYDKPPERQGIRHFLKGIYNYIFHIPSYSRESIAHFTLKQTV